jgi:hypothetical protein
MTNEFRKINGKNETRYVLEDASAGSTSAAAVAAVETSLGTIQRRVPKKKKPVKENHMHDQEFNGEYDDEAGMAESNLHTLARAVKGLMDTIDSNDNLPEWCQEKIAKAEMMLVSVWDYLLSQKEQGIDPEQDMAEADTKPGWMLRKMAKEPKGSPGRTAFDKIADKQAAIAALKLPSKTKQQGVAEGGKKKGADGKACWKGYRYAGTKDGKDSCVKVGEGDDYSSKLSEKLNMSLDEKSKSQKQAAIMAAAAHDPEFAKRVGISQRVAKEFNRADTGKDIKRLPVRVPKKKKSKE